MRIRFYQTSRRPLFAVLADMLHKQLGRQQNAVIRMVDSLQAKKLSDFLWENDKHRFLPHGLHGSDDGEHQPLWLSAEIGDNPIQAETLFICHALPQLDSGVDSGDKNDSEFADIILLFDDKDKPHLDNMRLLWKDLRDGKHRHASDIEFWKDTAEGWQNLTPSTEKT